MKFVILIPVTVVLLATWTEGKATKHRYGIKAKDLKERTVAHPSVGNRDNEAPMGVFTLPTTTLPVKESKKSGKKEAKKLVHTLNKVIEKQLEKSKEKKRESKKGKSKKAMIWPKKMLPRLEKILINKLSGGDRNGDSSYSDNYDGPSDSRTDDNDVTNDNYDNAGGLGMGGFSPTSKSDYSDNWDSVKPKHHKFNGMDVVPLMNILRKKLGDSSSFDSNGFTGSPSTKGNKFLMKILMNQALGRPDRGAVLKDMMQEFFLANGNDRESNEAREAFDELVGHNNLIRMNSDLEGETAAVDIGPTQNAYAGAMDQNMDRNMDQNMDQNMGRNMEQNMGRNMEQNMPMPELRNAGRQVQSQGFGAGVLQAQELPNGQIAPLGNQAPIEQRLLGNRGAMNGVANPTVRMLNSGPNFPQPRFPHNDVASSQVDAMAERIGTFQGAQQHPLAFANNNQLVIEEETENAARGIKPPPFASYRGNYDQTAREMKLGAHFQASLTAPGGNQAGILNGIQQRGQLQGQNELLVDTPVERFGDEIASFLPRRQSFDNPADLVVQENAAKRHKMPGKHNKVIDKKTKMRLGEHPRSHHGHKVGKSHKKTK